MQIKAVSNHWLPGSSMTYRPKSTSKIKVLVSERLDRTKKKYVIYLFVKLTVWLSALTATAAAERAAAIRVALNIL